jgi:hypothetical protein
MTTLSTLVSVFARVTGVPEATVFAYGRFAREAGLISQGGRGLGGAQMTVTDATNLLFAVCGTRITRDAGKSIVALRSLPGEIVDSSYSRIPKEFKSFIDSLKTVVAKKNSDGRFRLGDFVDYLINEVRSGEFESIIRSLIIYDVPPITKYPDPVFEEAVETFSRNREQLPIKTSESIDRYEDIRMLLEFSSTLNRASFRIDYNQFFGDDTVDIRFERIVSPRPGGDLSTESYVSQRTIFALGDALKHSVAGDGCDLSNDSNRLRDDVRDLTTNRRQRNRAP